MGTTPLIPLREQYPQLCLRYGVPIFEYALANHKAKSIWENNVDNAMCNIISICVCFLQQTQPIWVVPTNTMVSKSLSGHSHLKEGTFGEPFYSTTLT